MERRVYVDVSWMRIVVRVLLVSSTNKMEWWVSFQSSLILENLEMTKREIWFLLIGLGSGLVGSLAFICFPEIFFFAFFWHHGLLLLIFSLLIAGFTFLMRSKGRAKSVS